MRGSSTPRLLGSITNASGILDRPLSRAMTVGLVASDDEANLRLPQKFRAQHQALDLVGAALDLVLVVGEVNVSDHGAALQHRGRALQLQVLDQRDAVALGEQRAVGIPDLDVHGVSFSETVKHALVPSPLLSAEAQAKADVGEGRRGGFRPPS